MHIKRLNRMYRKAIPKRKKIGGKGVIYYLASLVKLMNTYLCKHQTLRKRVIEKLNVPFPQSIKTPSDLIFFASYIKQNSRDILGDEYETFMNPIFGRCVFTIQFDRLTFNLMGQYIRKRLCLYRSFERLDTN